MSDNSTLDLDRGAQAVMDRLREAADTIAAEHNMTNGCAVAAIWERLSLYMGASTRPGELDGRTAKWRCRFRIYSADSDSTPLDDSDPERPADASGSIVLAGLPAVASAVAELARGFHRTDQQLSGLGPEELARRLKGLRPTLSRRGGNAVWRVPYDTLDSFNPNAARRGYLMRVDIERETAA